jgi:hypothetical protein
MPQPGPSSSRPVGGAFVWWPVTNQGGRDQTSADDPTEQPLMIRLCDVYQCGHPIFFLLLCSQATAAVVAGAIASGLAGAAQFLRLGRPHSPRARPQRGLACSSLTRHSVTDIGSIRSGGLRGFGPALFPCAPSHKKGNATGMPGKRCPSSAARRCFLSSTKNLPVQA